MHYIGILYILAPVRGLAVYGNNKRVRRTPLKCDLHGLQTPVTILQADSVFVTNIYCWAIFIFTVHN